MKNSCYLSFIIYIGCYGITSAQTQRQVKYFANDSSIVQEVFHINLSDSSLNGIYEIFHANGSLKLNGWYKNNLPDSIWTLYFENGKIKATGSYQRGLKNGFWKYFNENGNLKSKGKMYNDLKSEEWTFYFENNNIKSTGVFRANEKDGVWNYFYEDGSNRGQTLFKGTIGYYTGFYLSGVKRHAGQIINEKRERVWEYFFEDGSLQARGLFLDGRKEGNWIFYHKNGAIESEGMYKENLRVGDWSYYHKNGKVSKKGALVNDKQNGSWRLYYPSGELMGEVNYEMNNGYLFQYYPSGVQKAHGYIKEGKKSEKWTYYNEEGVVEGIADFVDGKGDYIGYFSNGDTKIKGQLEGDKRIGIWTLYNEKGEKTGTYTPLYEPTDPIRRYSKSLNTTIENEFSTLPDFQVRKHKLHYFQPKINEYKTVILETNPLMSFASFLPLSLEYYIDQRLGYEIEIDILKKPFFKTLRTVDKGKLFYRGIEASIKQKFYHPKSKLGIYYFGHQLAWLLKNHQVNLTTTTSGAIQHRASKKEQNLSYRLMIGTRMMSHSTNGGVTLDLFFAGGVGWRNLKNQFSDASIESFFEELNTKKLFLSISGGVKFGLSLSNHKSHTLK